MQVLSGLYHFAILTIGEQVDVAHCVLGVEINNNTMKIRCMSMYVEKPTPTHVTGTHGVTVGAVL